MNILLAEDDPVAMRVAQLTLEAMGHSVTSTRDGEDAWKHLQSDQFQVVVSDWMMPGIDGLELCRRTRARKDRRYVYFILLTARVGQRNHLEAMDAGVDDFLPKPMRRDELGIRLRVAHRILSFISELRDLRRLVPICSYCKKIRDDKDYWQNVEAFMHKHAGVDFSHGICPSCYAAHVEPQLEADESTHPPR